jgi:hypothetical protein
MNSLVILAVVVFVTAIVVIIVLSASLLALVVFRFAPALNGTILALTTSDIGCMLRQMPLYPAWWPGRGPKKREKKMVVLALNPIEKAEYFSGFDAIHKPMFTSDKNMGLQFDFADRFAIERLIRKLEDDALEVFLVFFETPIGTRKILAASRYTKRGLHWYDLRPPVNYPTRPHEVPSNPHPMYLLGHQKQATSPRPR